MKCSVCYREIGPENLDVQGSYRCEFPICKSCGEPRTANTAKLATFGTVVLAVAYGVTSWNHHFYTIAAVSLAFYASLANTCVQWYREGKR